MFHLSHWVSFLLLTILSLTFFPIFLVGDLAVTLSSIVIPSSAFSTTLSICRAFPLRVCESTSTTLKLGSSSFMLSFCFTSQFFSWALLIVSPWAFLPRIYSISHTVILLLHFSYFRICIGSTHLIHLCPDILHLCCFHQNCVNVHFLFSAFWISVLSSIVWIKCSSSLPSSLGNSHSFTFPLSLAVYPVIVSWSIGLSLRNLNLAWWMFFRGRK